LERPDVRKALRLLRMDEQHEQNRDGAQTIRRRDPPSA
jgi:hypothetical protein